MLIVTHSQHEQSCASRPYTRRAMGLGLPRAKQLLQLRNQERRYHSGAGYWPPMETFRVGGFGLCRRPRPVAGIFSECPQVSPWDKVRNTPAFRLGNHGRPLRLGRRSQLRMVLRESAQAAPLLRLEQTCSPPCSRQANCRRRAYSAATA